MRTTTPEPVFMSVNEMRDWSRDFVDELLTNRLRFDAILCVFVHKSIFACSIDFL